MRPVGLTLLAVSVCMETFAGADVLWITGSYEVPGEDDYAAHFADAPAPVLERRFTLAAKPVRRAVWRIASPGMYDACVNGKRVNSVALPIWTAFDRRVLEDEYDVTALVTGGKNTLMLELGNGWWNPLPMKMWGRFNLRKTLPHGTPTARAVLEIEYADGTSDNIVTDCSWRASEGHVLRNNLYLGEKRDARRKKKAWKAARVAGDAPKGRVLPRGDMPPIVVYDRWKAKGVKQLSNGRWIVDMGVNFAGTMRATLKGTRDGDVVTFRYGELLRPDGTVNVMTSVCGQQKNAAIDPPGVAEQKDTVICPSAESFVYEPRFTFHGFRYVEVSGLRTAPSPEDFEALAWSADVKNSASFECSDKNVNLLREVCRRTFRSNLQGVQSDCPARERFGYGGDLAATAESFILNYDMSGFYRKVVRDRCDMEALHGVFPSTTPSVFPDRNLKSLKNGKFSMGWAVDVPILVDLLVRYYGDLDTMREAYPSLRRFLLNCEEAFDVNHVPPCIGDHEALEKADAVMTAQCHYHQFLKLTAKFARRMGLASDANRFEATARELEGVFAAAARYVPAKGFVGNGRQGEECFAIYHGMLPPGDLDAAYGILRKDVIAHDYALSTGIFSTQYLLEVLTARGDADIAGKVLTHRGFPGWYNMLDNGATTLWETWAQSDDIYSQNHPMFGSCAAWLMRGILGIKVAEDAVGCDKVSIEPHAVAGITSAKGHLDTPRGRISVSWRMENGKLKVEKSIGGKACETPYSVKGPKTPKPHERTAMEELSSYLAKRVSGKVLVDGRDGVVFHVGDTELARRNGLLSSQMPSEKWVVRSFGNEVLLNGGGTRGALFAVYRFLEEFCGVRWWSEFEEDMPPAGPLDLPAIDIEGRPAFAFRDINRSTCGSDPARFERRVGLNAHGGADLGGAFDFGPPSFCHTFEHYLPVKKYKKEHPEWYALRDGKRVGGMRTGQLCLTNPEVYEEVRRRLLAYIEKGTSRARARGVEPPRIYDVSHNDNELYCECDRCRAAVEKYGLSGVNLNFVNALAAEVAKSHPDVMLCTWAYQYTQDVPKGGVRAADNVIVRLCDTDSNQAASIAEPDNRAYYDRVVAWSKVTKHLFVWDYAVTFTKELIGLPFPSEFHYGDLYRHYRANNVTGVFWEHEFPYKADMWELKFFLETKLMENPELDCDALINRFMREYYGPAGKHVLAYRRLLDRIRREKKARVGWFPQLSEFDSIGEGDLAVCNRMLDAAEASVAGDAKLLSRVRQARLGLDRLVCLRALPVLFHSPGSSKTEERSVMGAAGDAARTRLREDWTKWIERYPKADKLLKKENNYLAGILSKVEQCPVPDQFRDRGYYDFPARFLSGFGITERIVDDPESPTGRAMRVDADSGKNFELPFEGGVYDEKAKKSCGSGGFKKIKGDGYHWYRLCNAKIAESCFLWLTRSWTTRLHVGRFPELVGKELEIWVSVKFTGPMFRPGTSGDSFIWIDRVILAVP